MVPTTGFANGRAGEVSKEEKLAAIQRQVEDGSLVVRKTAATPTVVDHERRAKRAEEAGRPDDLSDLELSEHELALEHCYDQARAKGNGQVLNAIEDFLGPRPARAAAQASARR